MSNDSLEKTFASGCIYTKIALSRRDDVPKFKKEAWEGEKEWVSQKQNRKYAIDSISLVRWWATRMFFHATRNMCCVLHTNICWQLKLGIQNRAYATSNASYVHLLREKKKWNVKDRDRVVQCVRVWPMTMLKQRVFATEIMSILLSLNG